MKPEVHYLMVDIQEMFNKVLELQTRIDLLSDELMTEYSSFLVTRSKFKILTSLERSRKALNKKLREKDNELFILSNLIQ